MVGCRYPSSFVTVSVLQQPLVYYQSSSSQKRDFTAQKSVSYEAVLGLTEANECQSNLEIIQTGETIYIFSVFIFAMFHSTF